jgi:hypothetical protein
MPVNRQTTQLHFLQEKIKQIGSAIFFNQSDSVMKLPTSVITSLKVDDYGYVWFFVKKQNGDMKEFETEFPVRLDFFKKGLDCFLQVTGKGWAVTDPEEVNTFIEIAGEEVSGHPELVLVKVKIMKAEYYETHPKTKSNWLYTAVSSMATWFRSTNHLNRNIYYPAS